eukprot:GDKJ01013631.1.p1 GENE.GDKJ01013631.1~~GDKJ01013631.1.p1  ORF type:complete len:246 (+),score=35.20 GDKJ01013631.1:12-749(+)
MASGCGKICVVTGGTKGMGRHIAVDFASKGFRVFALDVAPLAAMPDNVTAIECDIRQESAIVSTFQQILKVGKPHILINNAAISKFNIDFAKMTAEQWDLVADVNVRGLFLCSREFVRANEGESFGRIVNIASTRWNQNQPGWDAYGASKGAVVSLTTSMCISLSNTPITVNAIAPGWIQVDNYETELHKTDHEWHPSGRVGKPSDISNACLFLAAEDNDFINGHTIVIDGGVSKKMVYNHSWDL